MQIIKKKEQKKKYRVETDSRKGTMGSGGEGFMNLFSCVRAP